MRDDTVVQGEGSTDKGESGQEVAKAVEAPKVAAKPKAPKAPKVKKEKAPKAEKKPAKVAPKPKKESKPVKPKKTKHRVLARKPGPAMKALATKLKPTRTLGVCMRKGCTTKSVTRRAKWCATHKKEIRKAQLAANNIVWKKRVKAGEAGHHVAYRNAPTPWAIEHKEKALELAKKGRSIYEPDKLKKILAREYHTRKRSA